MAGGGCWRAATSSFSRGADGLEFWRHPVAAGLDIRPSVAGNELFLPVSDGRILAFDLGLAGCCGSGHSPQPTGDPAPR